MSQTLPTVIVGIDNYNASDVIVQISDSGYVPSTYPYSFDVSSNYFNSFLNPDFSVTFNMGITTTSLNINGNVGTSILNYTNLITGASQMNPQTSITSQFTCLDNVNSSIITFTDISNNSNAVSFNGNYINQITGYSVTNLSSNYLGVTQPTSSDKKTYFNFSYISSNGIFTPTGTIVYDPEQNAYTSTANSTLLNYQNLLILANKSIVHYTKYGNNNNDPVTTAIFNAMFNMNSYAFNRLVNYV
jgi:hypothetical protein